MKREWQPGDVALVRFPAGISWHRAMRDADGKGWGVVDFEGSLEVAEARPLLVIDPEDREQVERLADAFCEVPSSGWVDQMQAALRSLLTPPKPPEPERLAALVEDANGAKYVSVADHLDGWMVQERWQRIGGEINAVRNFDWSEIDVVRVLSEGWVEES